MAPPFCCGFRRYSSPEPEPIHLIDTSQTKGRFALSSHSASSTSSPVDVRPIQEIFASASRDEGNDDTPTVSARDLPSRREMASGICRRSSSRHRLHEAARNVRKRMSRDSGISKRSSKQGLRSSMSKEDMDRRDELKRALQERVRTDILEDDDTIYDKDAVPIKSPAVTWGRHEGLIQISPKQLSKAMRRSHSPSASVYTEVHQREQTQAFASTNTTATLTRMLTQRASHLSEDSEDHTGSAKYIIPERTKMTKKYVFDDEDSPRREHQSRSPSPLGRSKTVIREAPSTKPAVAELLKPQFLDNAESPLSPDLLPQRQASISDSVAGGDWRLSFSERISERRGDSLPTTLTDSERQPKVSTTLAGVYDTRIRPASEEWLHGASRLLSPSIHQKHLSDEHTGGKTTAVPGHHCDPNDEELRFGGMDGEDESPPYSAFRTARNSSDDSEPHIYNMHVPQRLASKSLLPTVSLPQLLGNNRQRSYTKGDSADFYVKPQPRRQASSPRVMPMAWDNHHPRDSSSVYSSQPESLLSSGRNSLVQGTSLADRFQQFQDRKSSDGIISVPASRSKSIDLDKLERHTMSTSFHSSNESLTMRELAAAETRIQPISRAKTLPKNSRFREDLKSISDETARTNPPRRRASNLDGSGDYRRCSGMRSGYDEATSIWEKALQEHSHEDTLLARTRLGSNSPEKHLEADEGPLGTRRPPSRPPLECSGKHHAVESWPGYSLQARLAAYELPSPPPPTPLAPVESRGRRPTVANDQRSVSTGSWSRYPSHTRTERGNSPAGQADQVFARDFADVTPGTPPETSPSLQNSRLGSGKSETRSMTFSKNIVGSIKRIYRTEIQGLERRLQNEARGHRSSISEGGMLEYPELEMVGSVSPPMPGRGLKTKRKLDRLLRGGSLLKGGSEVSAGSEADAEQAGMPRVEEAKVWSQHYRDCVRVPADPGAVSRAVSGFWEGSEDCESKEGQGGRHEQESGSYNLRASTLDFKKSLELDEYRERAKIVGLGGG